MTYEIEVTEELLTAALTGYYFRSLQLEILIKEIREHADLDPRVAAAKFMPAELVAELLPPLPGVQAELLKPRRKRSRATRLRMARAQRARWAKQRGENG